LLGSKYLPQLRSCYNLLSNYVCIVIVMHCYVTFEWYTHLLGSRYLPQLRSSCSRPRTALLLLLLLPAAMLLLLLLLLLLLPLPLLLLLLLSRCVWWLAEHGM
jgi:hypothetical protein